MLKHPATSKPWKGRCGEARPPGIPNNFPERCRNKDYWAAVHAGAERGGFTFQTVGETLFRISHTESGWSGVFESITEAMDAADTVSAALNDNRKDSDEDFTGVSEQVVKGERHS